MSTLNDFLSSIKKVQWYSQAGELPSGCLLFDTREEAENATGAGVWDEATDAVWLDAWGPAPCTEGGAARRVAWTAAVEAAEDATRDTHLYACMESSLEPNLDTELEAAWDAVQDASLLAGCIAVWDDPNAPNTRYAVKRWQVWQAGYGCLCDVGGTLYCYRRIT